MRGWVEDISVGRALENEGAEEAVEGLLLPGRVLFIQNLEESKQQIECIYKGGIRNEHKSYMKDRNEASKHANPAVLWTRSEAGSAKSSPEGVPDSAGPAGASA